MQRSTATFASVFSRPSGVEQRTTADTTETDQELFTIFTIRSIIVTSYCDIFQAFQTFQAID